MTIERHEPSAGRFGALALVTGAGLVNYIDRVTLSVAGPTMAHELHLSATELGLLLSAFLWAYAAAQAPVGALTDRLGPRPLLGAAMALWSAAQMAMGLATGLPQLIGARLALGLGEAPQWPVGARVVRAWFPAAQRGWAMGVVNTASTLAPALAPPVVTVLMLTVGWRGAFLATGAGGLVAAGLWLALYRDRAESAEVAAPRTPLRRLLAQPPLWAMTLGNAGSGYMNWFYAAWLPGYLQLERHFSVPKTGWAASIPFFCGFLGSLTGGWACDRLAAAGLAPIASRKAPIVAGLVGGGVFTGLAIVAPSDLTAIACVSAAVFCANLAGAAIWALAIAAAPRGATAQVGAVQNVGGLVGGALAPIVTGVSVSATHTFGEAMAITALVALGAAAIYALAVRREIEP
ncbi:MAG TPA: MFS transporter [Caulobacteraceae bacterium]